MFGIDVNTILSWLPQDNTAAMFILPCLFALKSLTMVFPLSVLFFASGMLFSPLKAVCVSTVGQLAALTVPYFLGRKCGSGGMDKFRKKYPRLDRLADTQGRNIGLLCFLMRIIGLIPGDVLSFCFGSLKVPYRIYAPLSLLGCMPIAVCYTLMGDEINDPTSGAFTGLVVLRVLLCIVSIILGMRMEKKNAKS